MGGLPLIIVTAVVPSSIVPWGLGFVFPAFIDSLVDAVKILGSNTANEEHLDVMLHRDELRVIHS